jgi:hypothetical protein
MAKALKLAIAALILLSDTYFRLLAKILSTTKTRANTTELTTNAICK